ncbi:hypothetical protein UFOVP600_8 [uncultured Caudovirales phage]|uniref:Uncharacterized protein n=1 Tax=uncultured Caudovirales phage TaxID=2100421 RepID=A0A6J5MZ71_9CAUD|nr:hypothetical protein UFOVP600_8 [uncultured Caudovirales phage]
MIVTEKKTIKIDRECKENPVFISWLNTYGGREHWLFSKVQTKGLITQNDGNFESYIVDLAESRGQIIDISKNAVPLLTVNCTVDVEDIDGIKTLLYSPCVEMLVSENPIKWQTVRPQTGSFKLYDTNDLTSSLQITLELPYINIQG